MLRLLLGRTGTGKTSRILEEISTRLNDPNDDHPIILFVPEQMSFQAEYEIVRRLPGKAFNRLQVLSFKRLAYRVFQEVGGLNKTFINDMTIQMVIQKIINENKDKFLLYNQLSRSLQFTELVHDCLKEFKNYMLLPEILDDVLNNLDKDSLLYRKLHDLNIIYRELTNVYSNRFIDQEDFYRTLNEKLPYSKYIKQADIYIDGYHNFTNLELEVVKTLILNAHQVTILLTIDNPKKVKMDSPDHLFNMPYRTYKRIMEFVKDNKIEVKEIFLDKTVRYENKPDLQFLETTFLTDKVFDEEVTNIRIYETESPASEVNLAARLIFNDVVENGASFSDYVIYTNDQDVYYPLIQKYFPLYNIPIFIDDQKLMLDHFLLNFIDACLEAVQTNLSYEAMFRAIKTEVFFPLEYEGEKLTLNNYKRLVKLYRERIDKLENYCLSHGIKGSDWSSTKWEYNMIKKVQDFKQTKTEKILALEAELNQTKQEITPLLTFVERFKKASNIKEQIMAIYQLLEDVNISEKLNFYEQLHSSGKIDEIDLNQAKKHKQVYNKLIALFDELVLVCGDYQVNTEEFIKIMRTGFRALRFAIVPPALDQVMIGSLKRTRVGLLGHFDDPKTIGCKKAIVLGVTEGKMPRVHTDFGLITNEERSLLESFDIELSPTLEQAFLDEYFIIYTVFCSAKEQLIITYPLSDNDKKESYPSELISHLLRQFPKLKVEMVYDFPDNNDDLIKYVTSPIMTAKLILEAISYLRKGYQVPDFWRSLYGYYKHRTDFHKYLIGVTYRNEPAPLTSDDIRRLNNGVIQTSVSGIEAYNSCPYAFFLERALRVQERDVQKMEPTDIGDLFHETLEEIVKRIWMENETINQVPIDRLLNLVDDIVRHYANKIQRDYFNKRAINKFLLERIKESLKSSIRTLHYQSQYSKYRTIMVEEPFGPNATKLKTKPISLPNGFTLYLTGIIDRVDESVDGNKHYISVIDYKSSRHIIDLDKVLNRLSLQLFTYLDVVVDNLASIYKDGEVIPSGVLYYQIQNPTINAQRELTEEEILKEHYAKYQMKGLTLEEKQVSMLFDEKLAKERESDIINVKFTQKGDYYSYSDVINKAEMDALRKFTRESIEEAALKYSNGEIPITPIKSNNFRQCQYCPYLAICKFDARLRENKYKELKKYKKETGIINLIEQVRQGDES